MSERAVVLLIILLLVNTGVVKIILFIRFLTVVIFSLFKNFLWDLLGKISSQLSAFIVSIVLTRLLKPEEYGIMGMAMVIIAISAFFLNMGFSTAIIQRKEISKEQLSSVYYLNLGVGILLFLFSFSLAGVIADFYNQPLVKPVFRALSFIFILNALNIVPSALLARKMNFKLITLFGIISTVISGAAGIIMAYQGYGVWSLVVQTISASFLNFLFIQVYIRFQPLWYFSTQAIKPLWTYGNKIFLSGLMDTIITRVDIFIIGRIFSPGTLGLYTRAQTLDVFVRQFSSGSIASVLFPYLSKNQDDTDFIRLQYKRALHIIMMLAVGIGGALYVVAEDLFIFLFSSRWAISGTYFRIMALAAFIWPVSSLMCTLIPALGNSKAFLKLTIYKQILFIPVYAFGFIWGLKGFLYCFVIASYLALFLNILYVFYETGVTVKQQVAIMLPYFFIGIIAAALAYFLITYAVKSPLPFWNLILGGMAFVVFYAVPVVLKKLPAWVEINDILKKRKSKMV